MSVIGLKSAECITVVPADFDHIEAQVPPEVMAGEEFEVRVTFVDRYGNPMPVGWEPETALSLTVSKPASVLPPVLTPENYIPGFRFRVSTEKMGGLTIYLRDSKGEPLRQWELEIRSGRPARLVAGIPARGEVGQTIPLTFQAVDSHGNVAYGYSPDLPSLVIDNPGIRMAGELKDLGKGRFEVPVTLGTAGHLAVSLKDRKKGLSGEAGTIDVAPAPLDRFEIAAGSSVVAGEDLAVTIRAMDRFGNLVTDYDSRYKGVRLYTAGGKIVPDLVAPDAFEGGVAGVRIQMRNSGEHPVQVSEIQSNIAGSFRVAVLPGPVEQVLVQTPDSAVAGEPFEITLEARDRFGNAAEVPAGTAVRLGSTGTVPLSPSTVDGSLFSGGVARVKVSYERAESFEITASIRAGGGGSTSAPVADPRELSRKAAERAREDAVRSKREARLREKRIEERTPAPEAAIAPKPSPAPRPSPEPKPRPAPKPAPEPKPVPAPKPAPVQASRPLRPGVLDAVVVDEADGSARVVFSTNGMTDYNVTTSAKLSRKWIDIEFTEISPELPDHITGGKDIVGEIYLEGTSSGRGVRISVEILPVRIGYDVYQEGDSIVLKVTGQ